MPGCSEAQESINQSISEAIHGPARTFHKLPGIHRIDHRRGGVLLKWLPGGQCVVGFIVKQLMVPCPCEPPETQYAAGARHMFP
jgi:hypothetical protein